VGIIARVPLASGLLSGKYRIDTEFAADDHRSYNRDGSAFDVGETFSGVDYETGVAAAQEFTALVADSGLDVTPAQAAIAWAWQQPGVSTVIPGARNVSQAEANAAAGAVGALPDAFLEGVAALYDRRIRAQVHGRW
jgi:aryl-alcohol dehydrogenase-like predicted oxidoreductase